MTAGRACGVCLVVKKKKKKKEKNRRTTHRRLGGKTNCVCHRHYCVLDYNCSTSRESNCQMGVCTNFQTAEVERVMVMEYFIHPIYSTLWAGSIYPHSVHEVSNRRVCFISGASWINMIFHLQ